MPSSNLGGDLVLAMMQGWIYTISLMLALKAVQAGVGNVTEQQAGGTAEAVVMERQAGGTAEVVVVEQEAQTRWSASSGSHFRASPVHYKVDTWTGTPGTPWHGSIRSQVLEESPTPSN